MITGAAVSVTRKVLQRSFTLAEVLIVLGIIGLIADMTIPTLIQNTQEKIAVSRLKKVYSTLENSLRLAVSENGTVENWNLINPGSYQGAENIFNNFKPYLNLSKVCGQNDKCFADSYKWINGSAGYDPNNQNVYKFALSDGTIIGFYIYSANCDYSGDFCAAIHVDINGYKKPNVYGKDAFRFILKKDTFLPTGLPEKTDVFFDQDCQPTKAGVNGYGCTAWVIYNENMDYLKCSDLSWDGKKSCK